MDLASVGFVSSAAEDLSVDEEFIQDMQELAEKTEAVKDMLGIVSEEQKQMRAALEEQLPRARSAVQTLRQDLRRLRKAVSCMPQISSRISAGVLQHAEQVCDHLRASFIRNVNALWSRNQELGAQLENSKCALQQARHLLASGGRLRLALQEVRGRLLQRLGELQTHCLETVSDVGSRYEAHLSSCLRAKDMVISDLQSMLQSTAQLLQGNQALIDEQNERLTQTTASLVSLAARHSAEQAEQMAAAEQSKAQLSRQLSETERQRDVFEQRWKESQAALETMKAVMARFMVPSHNPRHSSHPTKEQQPSPSLWPRAALSSPRLQATRLPSSQEKENCDTSFHHRTVDADANDEDEDDKNEKEEAKKQNDDGLILFSLAQ